MNRKRASIPRVALFTDTFFEVNGAAHTLRKLTEKLSEFRARMDVYCYGEHEGIEQRGPVNIISFDHRLSNNYYEKLNFELKPDFRIGARWREQDEQDPYSVVHLATPGSMGLTGRHLGLRTNLPMVGTYHTHLADYISLRSGKYLQRAVKGASWKFLRWFYKPCEWLLGPTTGVLDDLKRHGFKNQLGLFSRGIDTHQFSLNRRTRDDRKDVVSYVGRCSTEKNVGIIPDVVKDIETDLWIVGDGPELPKLQKTLSRAKFTGYLFGDSLAEAYANSDLLLFPSQTDTFGNVVLEAMASGTVPVILKGPGPSDFVTHGVNAMVCDSPSQMSQAIHALLKDQDRRTAMRHCARSFAETMDWRTAISALVGYYESVSRS